MIDPVAILRKRHILRQWKKLSGYRHADIIARGRKVSLAHYQIPVSRKELDRKSIFFFSDLHWAEDQKIGSELLQFVADSAPDWIVCGGDLISYSCFLDSACKLLGKMVPGYSALAVPGNWDKKRYHWFSAEQWAATMHDCNFRFLLNEEFIDHSIRFWGCDDFKLGKPKFKRPSSNEYSIVVAHNPDTVVELEDNLDAIDLIICGHTHAGQIRVPWFGALRASSRYWRKFDYGHYIHARTGTRLLVSAGVGTTGIDLRMFCRREAVLIEFQYTP